MIILIDVNTVYCCIGAHKIKTAARECYPDTVALMKVTDGELW